MAGTRKSRNPPEQLGAIPSSERLPIREAWKPAYFEAADASALQALQRGTATAAQQQRALDWIIQGACQTYDLPFRPEGDRETCLMIGRQFVGKQIVTLLNLQLGTLKRRNDG